VHRQRASLTARAAAASRQVSACRHQHGGQVDHHEHPHAERKPARTATSTFTDHVNVSQKA